MALLAFVTRVATSPPACPGSRRGCATAHGVPVTVGIGPRYLHSTGQLHKGGPDAGVFLVVVEDADGDIDVPAGLHFDQLLRAQAAGDLSALEKRVAARHGPRRRPPGGSSAAEPTPPRGRAPCRRSASPRAAAVYPPLLDTPAPVSIANVRGPRG